MAPRKVAPARPEVAAQTFENVCRQNLTGLAAAYAKLTGLSIATVSRQFHGNQAFLAEYETGKRSITVSKLEEMLAAFGAAWPEGEALPRLSPVPMQLGKNVSAS